MWNRVFVSTSGCDDSLASSASMIKIRSVGIREDKVWNMVCVDVVLVHLLGILRHHDKDPRGRKCGDGGESVRRGLRQQQPAVGGDRSVKIVSVGY